jgi:P27 family predicted phage terminase small subunit
MAKPGPSKAPNSLRLLHGDKNPNRFNANEPVPREGKLVPPSDLADDVREVWLSRLVELEAMNLAFPSDIDCWHAFCEAVVIHAKACRVLAQSPILVKGLNGGLVKNPALAVQEHAAVSLLRFAQQFGLTPSARATVEAQKNAGAESSNPFAGLG